MEQTLEDMMKELETKAKSEVLEGRVTRSELRGTVKLERRDDDDEPATRAQANKRVKGVVVTRKFGIFYPNIIYRTISNIDFSFLYSSLWIIRRTH